MRIILPGEEFGEHPINGFLGNETVRAFLARLYDTSNLIAKRLGERFPRVNHTTMLYESVADLSESSDKPRGYVIMPVIYMESGCKVEACEIGIHPRGDLFVGTILRFGFGQESSIPLDPEGLSGWVVRTVGEIIRLPVPLE